MTSDDAVRAFFVSRPNDPQQLRRLVFDGDGLHQPLTGFTQPPNGSTSSAIRLPELIEQLLEFSEMRRRWCEGRGCKRVPGKVCKKS